MQSYSSDVFDIRHASADALSFRLQAEAVDFAFQPIISTSSLCVLGFEALARFPEPMPNVCDLLDRAEATGEIVQVDMMLVKKAIDKFAQFEAAGSSRLFCNLDNRTYGNGIPGRDQITGFLAQRGLTPSNMSLEISERGSLRSSDDFLKIIEMLSGMGMKIALDDFGVGVSSLHMLMVTQPDYVKIDRAFIDGIALDMRKQAIVAKLCGLAHALGFMTVAEGVETEKDFRMARDLGCDLAQGYHIARPTTRIADMAMRYSHALGKVETLGMKPRVAELLTPVDPLRLESPLADAVRIFQAAPDLRMIPVIDDANMVLGAVLEEDIRRYLLSDFGPSLLHNKGAAPLVGSLLRRFPVGKAHGSAETLLDSYVASETSCGLILANDGEYAGYISNHALLRLATEQDLSRAREQNPLTELPGNRSIAGHIAEVLEWSGAQTVVLFDFDNFKAFNDCYGFAAGDRALLMFANLLRGLQLETGAFIGHIGGDDFFASLPLDDERCLAAISELCTNFERDAESLYSADDRRSGGISTIDRFGTRRFFPLLRASASILHLPAMRSHLSVDTVYERLTMGKKKAKSSETGFLIVSLSELSSLSQIA